MLDLAEHTGSHLRQRACVRECVNMCGHDSCFLEAHGGGLRRGPGMLEQLLPGARAAR